MKPCNDKITVSVNPEQKSKVKINGIPFSTALLFEKNYREKSPVLAVVVDGNNHVKRGEILLCHHNLFYLPSPYHLYGDSFSIPFSKNIFAKILSDGSLLPICGNMLCDRVDKVTNIPLPPEQREKYIDRVKVVDSGWSVYKEGQLLFTRPYSFYEIVYNFGGEEKRVHKCHSEMVIGFAK